MRRTTFARFAIACATGGLAAARAIASPIDRPRDRLAALRGATRLEIFHLPDDIPTYASLTATTLRQQTDLQRTAIAAAPRIAAILRALDAGRPHPGGAAAFDVRWDIVATTAHGRVSVRFDRFGALGAIDATSVAFAHPAFEDALPALVPQICR